MSETLELVRPLLVTVRADMGGGPQHIELLLRHFSREVRPVVACPQEGPFWGRYEALVGRENLVAIPHRRFSAAALVRLWREADRRRVTLVHSHGKGAGLYGRLLSRLASYPCVHTFHGLHIGSYGAAGRAAYLGMERLLSRWTRAIIAVSPTEAEAIVQSGAGGRLRPEIIPNGVRVPASPTSGPRACEPFRIVHVTRYEHQKNPELLLAIVRALARRGSLGRFRFDVVGDGPGRAALVREVGARGLAASVRVLGNVADPGAVLTGALACLSTSRWEGLSLALLEAMAAGVPVVATRVTGNTDLVRHGINGFLYDLDDAEAGADRLEALADDPAWPTLSRNAWQHVHDHHRAETMAQLTEALYRRVCDRGPAGGAE